MTTELPTRDACADKYVNKEPMSKLELFIYMYAPRNFLETRWRHDLEQTLKELKANGTS